MQKAYGWEDTEKGQKNQFGQRRDILKNVPWETYAAIQKDFKLLENITDSGE